MRTVIVVLAGLAVLAGGQALAQARFPDRPVRAIVPFAPGGATDVITRIVAEGMSKELGQQVVVENRSGANGTIGGDLVVKSPADGYTLFMGTTGTNILSPHFMKAMPYDTEKDFRGVAMVAGIANLLVVHPTVPARTVGEFIAHAKANPGKMNYAATGSGSRMAMELFLQTAGIQVTMVPYRGSAPALQDLAKGDVQATMDLLSSTLPATENGQLRPLAVSTAKRQERAPALPTLAESGVPGYEFLSWQGFFAPKQTPDAIVQQLSAAVNKALAAPEARKRILDLGAEPMGGSPAEMDAYIASEVRKMAAVAKAANVQPE